MLYFNELNSENAFRLPHNVGGDGMKNRRQKPRIGISFPVECNISPEKKSYFDTVSRDLSVSGTKILANDYFSRGCLLKLNINLITEVVNLKAKVAWCNKEKVAERYTLGLEFMDVNKRSARVLADFLKEVCPA